MSADTQGGDTLVAEERTPTRRIVPVVPHHIAMLARM